MKRLLLLLAATTVVAANSGAQAPFTVDTSFRFFFTPEHIEHWVAHFAATAPGGCGSWQPTVCKVHDRDDGTVMVAGIALQKFDEMTYGANYAISIAQDGSLDHYMPYSMGGGRCTRVPGSDQYTDGIWMYNYDGTLDHSYRAAPPTGMGGSTRWPSIVFEGRRILKPGSFRFTGEPGDIVLIQCDSVGELDTTFTPRYADGYQPISHNIRVLRNGQYLLNGRWSHYEGHPTGCVVRLWPDGSMDTTFYFPPWLGVVDEMLEQEDGKVILGGRFYFEEDTLHLIRLNLDGSVDSTFNNHNVFRFGTTHISKTSAGVMVIYPLEDGRIIIGGYFTSINGEERNGLACVDSTGNLLDCWAGSGLGAYCNRTYPYGLDPVGGVLRGIKCLENGDCYMFGAYKGLVDDQGSHPGQVMISRIIFNTSGVAEGAAKAPALELWPNPAANELNFSWAVPGSYDVCLRDLQGRTVLQRKYNSRTGPLDISMLAAGLYTVTVVAQEGQRATAKWVKE